VTALAAWLPLPARATGTLGVHTGRIAAALAVAAAAIVLVPRLPGELVAFGRFLPTRAAGAEIIYMDEGLAASVAVSRQRNGALTYHNAGKAQASTYPQDMRLQRMLGHLATLVPENGRSYLVIGLGAGITAGAVSLDPHAQRVLVADLEALTHEAAGRFFRAENFGVVDAPGVELRIDDGRHVLLTTEEKFDGITSDPFDPWVKGSAALYTREFWQLAKSRLNPGGVVTVFVQLYETTEEAVRSQLATFFEAFPAGAVFVNTVRGSGYDAVLLGRADEEPIDVERIEQRLAGPEYARVRASLQEIGFRSATELFATYAGRGKDLAGWLDGAVVNTDRNLRVQYLAGEGLNLNDAEVIQKHMTAAGPIAAADYFTGTPARLRALEQIIAARQGRF
jgi:spermidine synthase